MENLPHSLNPIAQCSSIAHTETHIEIHILDVKTFNVKRLTFHNNFDSNLNLQICATSFSTCNSLRKRTLMSWKFFEAKPTKVTLIKSLNFNYESQRDESQRVETFSLQILHGEPAIIWRISIRLPAYNTTFE